MAIAVLLKDTQYVVTRPPDVSLLKTCFGGGYSHQFFCYFAFIGHLFGCRNVKTKSSLEIWQLHRSVKHEQSMLCCTQMGHECPHF